MKKAFFIIPLLGIGFLSASCTWVFKENDSWMERFGTPELLLENAMDESEITLDDEKNQHKDEGNGIRDAIKSIAPFQQIDEVDPPKDVPYFTYQANWVPATSGPNFNYLSLWQSGFVRIHHKSSLGPHCYLCFSVSEEKAAPLVQTVFSLFKAREAKGGQSRCNNACEKGPTDRARRPGCCNRSVK